jgi:hypothetical protein
MFPTARVESDDLVVQEVADEFVIYDLKRHKVHSLNPTAAKVWGWCDGSTPPAAMADKVSAEFGLPADQAEPLLWLTLERLGKANLLIEKVTLPPSAAGLSRRRLLRMVGIATLLPVVYSMVAPTAAHAASPGCCDIKCKNQTGNGDCIKNSVNLGNRSCLECCNTEQGDSWKKGSNTAIVFTCP